MPSENTSNLGIPVLFVTANNDPDNESSIANNVPSDPTISNTLDPDPSTCNPPYDSNFPNDAVDVADPDILLNYQLRITAIRKYH